VLQIFLADANQAKVPDPRVVPVSIGGTIVATLAKTVIPNVALMVKPETGRVNFNNLLAGARLYPNVNYDSPSDVGQSVTPPLSCDYLAAGQDCTLREAVAAALPQDVIGFSEEQLYRATLFIEANPILIDKPVTIDGGGRSLTLATKDNGQRTGLFRVTSTGKLTLRNLSFNHIIANTQGALVDNQGGEVTLENVFTYSILPHTVPPTSLESMIYNTGGGTVRLLNTTLNSLTTYAGASILNEGGTVDIRFSYLGLPVKTQANGQTTLIGTILSVPCESSTGGTYTAQSAYNLIKSAKGSCTYGVIADGYTGIHATNMDRDTLPIHRDLFDPHWLGGDVPNQPLRWSNVKTLLEVPVLHNPAVNAVPASLCPDTDQGTFPRRKYDGNCDIGAYEHRWPENAPREDIRTYHNTRSAWTLRVKVRGAGFTQGGELVGGGDALISNSAPFKDQPCVAEPNNKPGEDEFMVVCPTLRRAALLTPGNNGVIQEEERRISIEFDPNMSGHTIRLQEQIRLYHPDNGIHGGMYVTINGLKSDRGVTLSGENRTRMLYFRPYVGTLDIDSLTFANGLAVEGGAIMHKNSGAQPNTVRISNSLFLDNEAHFKGGAIRCAGSNLELTNTTFIRNVAGEYGGAIQFDCGASKVTYGTFVDNRVRLPTNPISFLISGNSGNVGNFVMKNSLVMNSQSSDSASTTTGSASPKFCSEPLSAQSVGNIFFHGNGYMDTAGFTDTSCGNTDMLYPGDFYDSTGNLKLAYNGGSTQTLALPPGSPARTGGDSAVCSASIKTDQRGAQRDLCSIGAFGLQHDRELLASGHTVGFFDPGQKEFILLDKNSADANAIRFSFGPNTPDLMPISGDWNGDGIDTIGVYDRQIARFYLRNSNSTGPSDIDLWYGNPGDFPIAGCWDSSMLVQNPTPVPTVTPTPTASPTPIPTAIRYCRDGIGVYRPNGVAYVFLRTSTAGGTGYGYYWFTVSQPGSQVIVGDWNKDGFDSVGEYVATTQQFFLSNSITNPSFEIDEQFGFGNTEGIPIAGAWDDPRKGEVGLVIGDAVYLRVTPTAGQTRVFTHTVVPKTHTATWVPISGQWLTPTATHIPANPNTVIVYPTPNGYQSGDGAGTD
jgi:predicted outer membrane repeat protein